MEFLLSNEKKTANHDAFDIVTNKLYKQLEILNLMKATISTLQADFNSMYLLLHSTGEEITLTHYGLYDIHAQAFIHSLLMHSAIKDSTNTTYFNPVVEGSTTTDVVLTIQYPNSTVSPTLTQIENITIDATNMDMYIGDLYINALSSAQIAIEQIGENPQRLMTPTEFINGLLLEVEKLIIFTARVKLCEQKILSAIKYISELKGMGLY